MESGKKKKQKQKHLFVIFFISETWNGAGQEGKNPNEMFDCFWIPWGLLGKVNSVSLQGVRASFSVHYTGKICIELLLMCIIKDRKI